MPLRNRLGRPCSLVDAFFNAISSEGSFGSGPCWLPSLELPEPTEAFRLPYDDVFFRMGRAGAADPTVEPGREPDGLPSRGEFCGNNAASPSREPTREILPFWEPSPFGAIVATGMGVGRRRLLARDAAGAETSDRDRSDPSLFLSVSSSHIAASLAAALAATSSALRIRGGAPFRAHGSTGSIGPDVRSSTSSSSPSSSATERGPSGVCPGEWPGVCHGVDPRLAAGVCPGLPILARRLFSSSHASQVSNPPAPSPYAPTELCPSSLLCALCRRERRGADEDVVEDVGALLVP